MSQSVLPSLREVVGHSTVETDIKGFQNSNSSNMNLDLRRIKPKHIPFIIDLYARN